MRLRLLLVLLCLTLAVMSVAPAAAAPPASPENAGDTADTKERCGPTVADGTPVLLGSLLDVVTNLLPGGGAPLPLATAGPCTGVRPGAPLVTGTGGCSFNYLFAGSDGRRYMGTAGHCVLTEPGEATWGPGAGPEARDGLGQRVGEFAYAVLGGVRDFALVRLDPGVAADPQMCYFGGPVGVNDDLDPNPVALQHYGQGVLLGDLVPGRTAVALSLADPDQAFANGLVLFGDSGGAINSADGRAVGVIVTTGLHLADVPNIGLIGITRLSPQVRQAEDNLGVGLSLVTAPKL